ncbi:chromosome segregation protein SMC [Bradymonas sediminis]|uniref:Chromosome partition protein Smc n=2 Tax=Bradymonas sediminis TaxID=1548548 RepID=A0A2Z4FJ99_9DELT|nr:chromosome segregation protein SMC [Bradymonas sediminis]
MLARANSPENLALSRFHPYAIDARIRTLRPRVWRVCRRPEEFMKLRRIQLVGFKSFKDKVTIELSDNMNGIVGPNGCGKSNVVDALKWAMGDMSAKSLRGAALSDVIFAGSQNHRGAGMAEVTLTFENEEALSPSDAAVAVEDEADAALLNDGGAQAHRLEDGERDEVDEPDAAADFDANEDLDDAALQEGAADDNIWSDGIPREFREMAEISITRRLHRSGESEYLLNKTPCRLMDIRNLLAGTGLGKQGYSVIEQGEIAFVVSAKPSERRLIIEEASGITRYKSQRDRSQRKLDRAQENLQRIDDVVAEVKKQLRSLERQAQRAERFKKLSEELRVLEISAIVGRRNVLSEKAAKFRKALESGRGTAEKARETLKKLEAELSTQKIEAFVAERNNTESTEHFYKLDTRLNLAKSNRKHLADSLAEAKNRQERALSEHADQVRRRGGLKAELERVRADLEGLDDGPEDSKIRLERIEAELVALKETFRQAEQLRNSARSELENTRAEIRRVRDRREWLVSQKDEIKMRRAKIGDEIEGAERDVEDFRRALNRLRMDFERSEEQRAEGEQNFERAQARLKSAQKNFAFVREEFEEYRAERIEVSARVQTLSEMRRRGDGYTEGVQRVLEWAREGGGAGEDATEAEARGAILGPVGGLIEVPEGNEAAVSAYFGEVFNDIVATDRQAAMDAVGMLSREKIGRAGFYILENAADDPVTEFQAMLEGLQIVDDLASVDRGGEQSETRAWATREGDIEFASGRIVGGHVGDQAESLLRQARELKELQERLEQVRAWEIDAQEELDAFQDKVKFGEESVSAARKLLEEYGLEKRRIEQEVVGEERELERAEKRVLRIRAEVKPLEERLKKIEADAAALGDSSAEFVEMIPHLESKLEEQDRQCQKLRIQLDEAQARATEYKVELAQASERRRSLTESVERLERSLESNQRQIIKLDEEAKEQATRLREFEDNSTSTAAEVVELEKAYAEAKENAEAVSAHLELVQNEVRRLELAILECRNEVEKEGGSLQQIEMSLREVGIEIEHMDRNLMERFEMGLFEASQIADAYIDANPSKAEMSIAARDERIKQLRRDIDKMGAVNAMAVHEFEEAREREEFLADQQLDLQASIDDLNKAIRRMDRESRKRFRETFEAVNERFQEFFPRLFRGGHARLMLTDPENVLESGVDIEVSPPGKRLQNVTLLSGGEKALTAVSLIFAIFSLKPTPFSVLDEVDAPLDEANVGRYAEMVRELSAQSQMIVITHNRRSMEVCDALYGVTMEEPGVSKVVSVRLDDIARGDKIDEQHAS